VHARSFAVPPVKARCCREGTEFVNRASREGGEHVASKSALGGARYRFSTEKGSKTVEACFLFFFLFLFNRGRGVRAASGGRGSSCSGCSNGLGHGVSDVNTSKGGNQGLHSGVVSIDSGAL
jgi:hypothetical protein